MRDALSLDRQLQVRQRGKTAFRVAMMAWSTGSARSYPDSKRAVFAGMHDASALVAGATLAAARKVWAGEACHGASIAGGNACCLRALCAVVPPLLRAFRPDIVVSQHGCDTHRARADGRALARFRAGPVLVRAGIGRVSGGPPSRIRTCAHGSGDGRPPIRPAALITSRSDGGSEGTSLFVPGQRAM